MLSNCPEGRVLLMRLLDGRIGKASNIIEFNGVSYIYMTFPGTGVKMVRSDTINGYAYARPEQFQAIPEVK